MRTEDALMTFPKIVEGPHYHLWTDALHARALAKQANNRWDRGTYVRWTVTTAWTVLEMACEDALETPGIGRRFKENRDAATPRAPRERRHRLTGEAGSGKE